jgi:hypothetical protein
LVRPHLSLRKDVPLARPIQRFGNIVARPLLDGSDRTSKVHDRVNNKFLDWHAGWSSHYRQYGRPDKVDGTVSWDGFILDGWRPLRAAQ